MAAAQSDSEDEGLLEPNLPVAVQPYLFEPRRKEDREQPQEALPTDREDRTANTDW